MMVNYWFNTFKSLTPFQILPYQEVVELYNTNAKLLQEKKLESFGWNDRPINSDEEKIDTKKPWNGFSPLYFNIDPINDKVIQAKADIHSMDMSGLGTEWSHYLYLTIPSKVINNYMTNMHDNDDVTILRKYIDDVEKEDPKWETDYWRKLKKDYDKKYSEKSSYTDFYETHDDEYRWRQDFDIGQYVSLKKNGIIYPICYNSSNFILRRGTHRAVLLAKAGSDIPIFIHFPSLDITQNFVFKLSTPNFFNGSSLSIKVETKFKKLRFFLKNKKL